MGQRRRRPQDRGKGLGTNAARTPPTIPELITPDSRFIEGSEDVLTVWG
jgi:hypothetical protein